MTDVPARLSVVTLGARDLPRLRQFYRDLDWREVSGSDDDWAAFLLGGVVLALYPVAELADEAGVEPPTGADWSGITLACNVDTPDQVDRAYAAALRAGATAVADPVDRPWGGRSGYIADPEGNRWEIAWASTARFDETGAVTGFGD
ncbi:VOC family protein [Spiractinospora alimapuensis]|uniref:VOC family protein n=1 Tax=Spiractinospora alimapuensis TaxID=2820884 RepID=UPI001F1EA037|nr:VOC family protein [Spiractinospora alimapuensis]QVQ54487.1 VOC family protein [Spiractinospora alimapuensis]